jgi:hypothetical protein
MMVTNPTEGNTPISSVPPTTQPEADQVNPAQPEPGEDKGSITQKQATEILAELKMIKQRLLWLLIIVGFFAARAVFFHY